MLKQPRSHKANGLIKPLSANNLAAISRIIFLVTFSAMLLLKSSPAYALGTRVIVIAQGAKVSDSARAEISALGMRHLDELGKFYGFRYEHPVKVILAMDERAYGEAAGEDAPSWSVAVAQRRQIVIRRAGENFGTQQFNSTLKHELSHVLLGEMFALSRPGALPRWLDEGLAVYVSGEWEMPEAWTASKTEMYTALRSGQALDFDEISASFPYSEWKARIAYAQSYHFVAYLIKRFGEDRMRGFLKHLAAGEEFHHAFKASMREDFSDTEAYWRDHIAGRGGLMLFFIGISQFDNYIWMMMSLLVIAAFIRYLIKRLRRSDDSSGASLDFDDPDDFDEEWDEDSMGHRPWRPGRRRERNE
jgi:hypothetical protein